MTEDNFEEFLRKAAQSYNVPPARVPREDMWGAIQAQRARGPHVVYGGGSPTSDASRRRFGSKIWLGAAAAAVLFLATGVGIGRWSATSNAPPPVAAVDPTNAGASASTEGPSNSAVPDVAGTAASPQTPSVGPDTSTPRVATGDRGAPRVDQRSADGTRAELNGPSSNSATPAYQLTAVRHLSEAEALLTSFRTRSTADQQMDAQLGSWARSLLSNTRLLLDSPVANDPQRRPLLEDLELVLVQIVQLSPGSPPQERELIEKTLQQDHVMTRLRTAIPAGPQRGS
jgi:hypothetical protein